MKMLLTLSLLISSMSLFAQFDRYFHNKTLRVDYAHCGNHEEDHYFLEDILAEPYWGGSKVNLIDTLEFGNYSLRVFDLNTNKLIYSRGFNTLFGEWQTVEEAKHMNRNISESVVMPFPRNDVRMEIWKRNKKGIFEKKYSQEIDVDSYFIRGDRKMVAPTYDVHISCDPANAVDVVLLADGYQGHEMDKFKKDCEKFAEGLFRFEPYKSNKDKFNIRAVLTPSAQSGADIPKEGIWKNTAFDASFYTFDSERYIMTYNFKALRDAAANVPYDFIYVIANTDKYGGGAIYNHYGMSVSSNEKYAEVYVHEFGHLLLGLGDEYEGNAAYSEMYSEDVEPWEPNLTTLVDFDSKWKDMLAEDTKIPTEIDEKDIRKLGVYEGGGYATKGIYRPSPSCLMRVLSVDYFCPVCTKAIQHQIDFYTK